MKMLIHSLPELRGWKLGIVSAVIWFFCDFDMLVGLASRCFELIAAQQVTPADALRAPLSSGVRQPLPEEIWMLSEIRGGDDSLLKFCFSYQFCYRA